MTYVTDYTALLTGSYWSGIEVTGQPVFVTYSFDAKAPAADKKTLSASAYATFTPFTAQQATEAQQALAEWSANSGVIFEQVAPGKGDINFAAYNFSTDPNYSGAGGIGFYPWGNWNFSTYPYFAADLPGSGNILMNTAFGGVFDYVTLLHEIGHALGLKHPDQAWTNFGTNPPTVHNQSDPSTPLPDTVMNEGPTTLTHLGAKDIQAIQSIYGTAAAQGSMDTSWSWNAKTGTLTQHLTDAASLEVRGVSTNNVIYAGSGNDQIFAIGAGTNTVYAGSGTDLLVGGSGTNTLVAGTGADTFNGTFGKTTVSFANAAANVTVNLLNPALNTGIAANDTFINIHRLIGSNHGDTLTADNAGDTITGGSGNDTINGGTKKDILNGGAGDDAIYGGGGGDTLTGGLGADRFIFKKLSDSTVATNGRATITDFSSAQGDQIDLSALATALHETLTFIGSNPFSNVAGQVRYAPSGSDTLVTLDSTGNGTADFAILLKHSLTLSSADFILGGGASSHAMSVAGLGHAASALTSGGGEGAYRSETTHLDFAAPSA